MSLHGPQWRALPMEIVHAVVCEAAYSALKDDASWIAELSLVSRAVYNIVTPILYATLVVSDYNGPLVLDVIEDARRMAYVRKLCFVSEWSVHPWFDDPLRNLVLRKDWKPVFAGIEELVISHSSGRALAPCLQPARLCVQDVTLTGVRRKSYLTPVLSGMTHASFAYPYEPIWEEVEWRILGDPMFGGSEVGTSINAVHDALQRLSALTHLALDMSSSGTRVFDEDQVLRMLSDIIQNPYRRLEVVALRVAGGMLSHRERIVRIVTRMQDSRLRVWFDDRVGDALALRVSDARTGCDVWTEARQICI